MAQSAGDVVTRNIGVRMRRANLDGLPMELLPPGFSIALYRQAL